VIVSKTPLRMSFVGGGSDLPAFYREEMGAVLSTSIDKYMYICVNKKFDGRIRISYTRTEEVERREEVEHPLVREALDLVGIDGGIEIASMADIPSKGSGLGSSSTYTVGLLNALYAYRNQFASKEKLASQACEIEIDRCGEPIGKQDQYAAAYGGLNLIRFHPDDSVSVDPVICIQPGKPNQNAFVERFNRSFREEVLDANLFNSISEAQEAADDWVIDYNEFRPHDSLGDKTPMEFMPRIFKPGISSSDLST